MKSTRKKKANRRKRKGCWSRLLLFALCSVFLASFCYFAYKAADELLTSRKEQDAFKELSAIVSQGRMSPGSPGAELPSATKNAATGDATDQAADDMKYGGKEDLKNRINDGTKGDDKADVTSRTVAENGYGAGYDSDGGVSDSRGAGVKGEKADDKNDDMTNDTRSEVNGDIMRDTGDDVKIGILNATGERDGAESEGASSDPASPDSPEQRAPLPQYLPLYEMNPDFFGWISIEGTKIDYPVMYSPDRPEFYIRHAFDGSDSNSGVPFVDGNCPADGNYYIIYGHHMKNQTMFGQLPLYAKQSYWEEHPVIRFDTLYEQREYQVIAAFYSRIYDRVETGVFRYYEYFDLTDKEKFSEYVNWLRTAAIYDTGFETSYGDELLVLSTCNYHVKDGRFVVVAIRKDT